MFTPRVALKNNLDAETVSIIFIRTLPYGDIGVFLNTVVHSNP